MQLCQLWVQFILLALVQSGFKNKPSGGQQQIWQAHQHLYLEQTLTELRIKQVIIVQLKHSSLSYGTSYCFHSEQQNSYGLRTSAFDNFAFPMEMWFASLALPTVHKISENGPYILCTQIPESPHRRESNHFLKCYQSPKLSLRGMTNSMFRDRRDMNFQWKILIALLLPSWLIQVISHREF